MASRVVKRYVSRLLLIDAGPFMIESAQSLQSPVFLIASLCCVFCKSRLEYNTHLFDTAYMLDVLENISQVLEPQLLANLRQSLMPKARVIIGIPSTESQIYSSPVSKAEHINCKTKEELQDSLSGIFSDMFCLNRTKSLILSLTEWSAGCLLSAFYSSRVILSRPNHYEAGRI